MNAFSHGEKFQMLKLSHLSLPAGLCLSTPFLKDKRRIRCFSKILLFLKKKIEVWLIYKVVLVSGVQKSDSLISSVQSLSHV